MIETSKTIQDLLEENYFLHQRIKELEQSECEHKRVEDKLTRAKDDTMSSRHISRLCLYHLREGKWIDFNDAALEMFGYDSREELSRIPITSLYVTSEEHNVFLSLMKKQGYVKEHPVMLRRRDGAVINSLITAGIQRDADGSKNECYGTIRSVTENKQAKYPQETVLGALGKSESMIRAITDSAQDAILMMDPTGCISFWNPAAEHIFGYTSKDAIGRDLHHFLAPRCFLEAHRVAFERFKTTGQGKAADKTTTSGLSEKWYGISYRIIAFRYSA